MRILITWGSERGGTEGIARILGERLREHGFETDLRAARDVRGVDGYDAVIVGGALYINRWHRDARRFVLRHTRGLRKIPVWLFSSGPLDDSAARETIAPPARVQALMERVGGLGHMTFGGRLAPDATGFPAAAMARKMAGDWRDPAHIRAWADDLAEALPTAEPGRAIDHAARSVVRLLAHGVAGWAVCGAVLSALLAVVTAGAAIALYAVAAPIVFAVVSRRYFAPPGAREPLPTAAAFTAVAVALTLLTPAWLLPGSVAVSGSLLGTWLPFALIFAATLITGFIVSTLPWPDVDKTADKPGGGHPSPPAGAGAAS